MRRLPKGLMALPLGLAVALLAAEPVARWVIGPWLEDLAGFNEAEPTLHQPSANPELVYELVPGASKRTPGARNRISINEAGFRGPVRAEERAPGGLRILAFGGSNTFGPQVGDDLTWPSQLEHFLAEASGRPVEVWNLGVSGYETHQKVALMRSAIPRARPDLAIVQLHNMGPRYLLPGMDPLGQLRRNPCQLCDWVMVPRGCPGARLLLRSPLRSPLLPVLAAGRQARRFHYDRLPRDELLLRTWTSGLRALKEAAAELGVPVLILVPPPGLARESAAARAPLEALGLPILDLSKAPTPLESTWLEPHPDEHTYRLYGRLITERLWDPDRAELRLGRR